MATIRLLGIDPGLRNMGWGIIDVDGNNLRFVASGTIKSDNKATLAIRLCQLYTGLNEIITHYKPEEAAIEHVFVNKDAGATLKLGQARGIALLVPAQHTLPIAEYAPNQIKKSVIGVGHGEKQQIHMMVKMLLPRATFDTHDAADALAIAICHCHHRQSLLHRLR